LVGQGQRSGRPLLLAAAGDRSDRNRHDLAPPCGARSQLESRVGRRPERNRCQIPSSPAPASLSPAGRVGPTGGCSGSPGLSPSFAAELRVLAPARLEARLWGAGLAAPAVTSSVPVLARRELPERDRAGRASSVADDASAAP